MWSFIHGKADVGELRLADKINWPVAELDRSAPFIYSASDPDDETRVQNVVFTEKRTFRSLSEEVVG